jgi:polysaccharide pyruvyl transferase WcaK-like protein
MRLFAVGDVGGPSSYHLGDEAMLEANVDAFRQIVPGIQFTVMSADPAWTGKRYGVESASWDRPSLLGWDIRRRNVMMCCRMWRRRDA